MACRVAELIGGTFPDPGLPPLVRLEGLFLARMEMFGKECGIARLIFSDQFAKALPAPAIVHIHGVVMRTRAFVIQALTDGMREGSVRRDLPADDLAVPVMGTLQHMGFLTALAHREPQMPRP